MILIIIGIIYYTQNTANSAAFASLQSIKDNNFHKTELDRVRKHLQNIEKLVYRHTVYHDLQSRENITSELTLLKQDLLNLKKHFVDPGEHSDQREIDEDKLIIAQLISLVRKIETYIKYYYHVIDDVSLRFPGMSVLLNKLLVNNKQFIQATDEALNDFQQTTNVYRNRQAENLFIKSRYAWVQQVSWFRLFVANRSGIFGAPEESMKLNLKNRQIYMNQVGEYLKELKSMDNHNRLDVLPSISLATMKKSFDEYEKYFVEAKTIYSSDEWRADYPFLKDLVQPAFEKATELLSEYEEHTESIASDALQKSNKIAEGITSILWFVAIVVMSFFVLAYFMFDYILIKPVEHIASALDAEAKGESFSPLMKAKTKETEVLINAFRNMQGQVHSRQRRLSSILENAGEGILTVNCQGIIESFNSAAEALFGYDDSEVIGQNISILMPDKYHAMHDGMFEKTKLNNNEEKLNLKLEVDAIDKNSRIFPVSIKVSELEIEGRSLFTAIVEDISERKSMIEDLRKLAERDSLTGLYNRLYFTEELERIVGSKERHYSRDDALLYIDLDNFKYTNDILGHLAGDELLIEVTSLLEKRTRQTDLLARIGGDEFAVILYDVDQEIATKVAEQYRKLLQEYIFKYDGKVVDVGCSIGVAVIERGINNKDEILSRADFSCHIAKQAGRNKVHIYSAKDQAQMDILSSDIGWTRRIKSSLEEDRFIIAKQPMRAVDSGKHNRCEILLRMVDEHNNTIMPTGFIKPAERFGLMVEIDKWVVKHAISMLSQDIVHQPDINYSINLSAQSFDSNEVIELITSEISKYNIEPSRLTFEITETVAMADMGLTIKFLNKLRKLGCETAIDDFGVGYSSFAYLKELPVDYVKIDGSFVKDVTNNSLNRTILKSLNDVAQAMGKKTVAEFVETEEIIESIKSIGIDFMQGIYIGEPKIPTSEYKRLGLHIPVPRLKIVS